MLMFLCSFSDGDVVFTESLSSEDFLDEIDYDCGLCPDDMFISVSTPLAMASAVLLKQDGRRSG